MTKTDKETITAAIEFIKTFDEFPDDYEDVNDILTGLALLTQSDIRNANSIKVAIEAAFILGWQRRGMIEVDRGVWGELTP